jgi:DNA excision repair protein ERCC-5
MGIPYIEAPEEADSQCAWLVKNGFASSVLTEDMDILTFGANKIYRNLGSFKKRNY